MGYTGWLSPTGELVKCDGYAHMDMARKIANDLHIAGYGERIDDALLAHGWVRISRLTYSDCGLAFWLPTRLSVEQRLFLQRIADDTEETISQWGMKTLTDYDIC